MSQGNRKKKKGFALGFMLLVLVLVVVVGFATSSIGIQRLSQTENYHAQVTAQYTATSGIAWAIYVLSTNSSLSGPQPPQVMPVTSAKFQITITNNVNGTGSIPGVSIPTIPPGMAEIDSVGSSMGEEKKAVALAVRGSAPFQYALFANQSLQGENCNSTDSFNSALGSYASTKQASGGNIGTNAANQNPPAVTLDNNNTINGSINVAQSNPQSFVQMNNNSTSQGINQVPNVNLPPVTIPNPPGLPNDTNIKCENHCNQTLPPGAYGELEVEQGNNTLTLTSGTYVFSQVELENNSQLIINPTNGPVKIYITKEFEAENNATINAPGPYPGSGKPTNLLIYMGGGDENPEVELENSVSAYFGLFAPQAEIELENGDGCNGNPNNSGIYGSVVGNTAEVENGIALHYDKALSNWIVPGGSQFTVVSRFNL